jgi:amidase
MPAQPTIEQLHEIAHVYGLHMSDAPREEKIAQASEMNANNCPFNVTDHPVMTVPCGLSDGLPVGMMLVGRRGEDATVLRAAHAFEQMSGYTVRPKPLSAL